MPYSLNESKYLRNVICIPSPNQSNILSAPCDSWWKALGSPVTASCHYRHSTRARPARTSAIREYALFNSASSKLPSTHIGLAESVAFLGTLPPDLFAICFLLFRLSTHCNSLRRRWSIAMHPCYVDEECFRDAHYIFQMHRRRRKTF